MDIAQIKILRLKQVEEITGLKKSALYAKLNRDLKRPAAYDPTFPKPIKLGAHSVGWAESEIQDWLAARAQERG